MRDDPEHQEELPRPVVQAIHAVAGSLFVSAFLTALCRLLIRHKPWVAVAFAVLFGFLALWGFDWFMPKIRRRKLEDRAANDWAAFGLVLCSAAVCSTIFLNGAGMLWLAAGQFVASMILLYVAVRLVAGGMRAFWRMIVDDAEEAYDTPATPDDPFGDDYLALSHLLMVLITGLVYLAVFFPITVAVRSDGTSIIDALLLVDSTGAAAGLSLVGRLRLVLSSPQYFMPMGVLYSATLWTYIVASGLKPKPLLESAAGTFGLITGYAAAALVAPLVSTEYRVALLTPGLAIPYVLLLHYVSRSVLEYVPKWGTQAKYDYLIGGLESMGTAFILSRCYGPTAAIFGGVVFYLASFAGAAVWEATKGRLLLRIARILPTNRMRMAFEEVRYLIRSGSIEKRRVVSRDVLLGILPSLGFPVLVWYLARLALAA